MQQKGTPANASCGLVLDLVQSRVELDGILISSDERSSILVILKELLDGNLETVTALQSQPRLCLVAESWENQISELLWIVLPEKCIFNDA